MRRAWMLWAALFAAACASGDRPPPAGVRLEVPEATRFAGGATLPPGAAHVAAAAGGGLSVSPRMGEPIALPGVESRHDLAVAEPRALLVPDAEGRARIALLFPDGRAISGPSAIPAEEIAAAYVAGILERGAEGAGAASPAEIEEARRFVDALGPVPRSDAELLLAALGDAPDVVMGGTMAIGREGTRIDEARIYHGNSALFQKPGEVDLDAVYARIPEYQEVVRKELDPSHPRYLILLRAASHRFRTAVRRTAKDDGYDLIGGRGAIRLAEGTVPDITGSVAERLPE